MAKLKYTKEKLEEAVKISDSISDVVRFFGKEKSGSVHNHISKKIKYFGIDISHFTRKKNNNSKYYKNKIKPDEILCYNRLKGTREASKRLRRAMLEFGISHSCSKCKNKGKWQEEELVLEIDHINENRLDNRIENLRFLCPNCHSLRGNNIPVIVKICKKCKSKYVGNNKTYCSFKCRKKDKEIKTKACKECRKEYIGINKEYCSKECFNKYKRLNSNKPSKEQLSRYEKY